MPVARRPDLVGESGRLKFWLADSIARSRSAELAGHGQVPYLVLAPVASHQPILCNSPVYGTERGGFTLEIKTGL